MVWQSKKAGVSLQSTTHKNKRPFTMNHFDKTTRRCKSRLSLDAVNDP